MSGRSPHLPVLVEETLSFLAAGPGKLVVDGTVGFGGHAEAILQRSEPDGRLLGLDVDEEALEHTARRLRPFADRVTLRRASFRSLHQVLSELEITEIDGLLLDLGMSSRQVDEPARGFRFSEDSADVTPLDMRMDRRASLTAADLLGSADEATLVEVFQRYGELPGSRRLARTIVETRREAPLVTTGDLLRVVAEARVGGGRRHHPATLVFQALRMAVNDEIPALEAGLDQGIDALAPGGRLVVIAYHSIEDRVVKNQLRSLERGCICPPEIPVCMCGLEPRLRRLTRRPVRASDDEIRANPRARSALLRAAETLPEPT